MKKPGFGSAALAAGLMLLVALGSTVAVGRAHAMAYLAAHDMGGHMSMTKLRPIAPGDKERADAVIVAARKYAEGYLDFHKALADGYEIFLPDVKQHVYHFTLASSFLAAQRQFDVNRPTSLLYERLPGDKVAYKLVGVMYTDRIGAPESELNERIPLSIAQWHVHTNLCLPPGQAHADVMGDGRFGLHGSIATAEACRAAGGRFQPHFLGWMVHVYPFEKDPAKIWAIGMDDDDDHEMMPGMKM